jgi:hypothetical protein
MILPEPILPFCKNSFGDLDFYSLSDGAIDRPLREGVVANASLDDLRQVLREGGYSDTVLRSHFTAAARMRLRFWSGCRSGRAYTRMRPHRKAAAHQPHSFFSERFPAFGV